MADKKISALTAATTPLAGTEVLPIVQGGATVKVSAANITAGRDVSAKTLTGESNGVGGPTEIFARNTAGSERVQIISRNSAGISYVQTQNSQMLIGSYDNFAVQIVVNNSSKLLLDTNSDVKVQTGNLVVGTAGKGIDFSANTHAAGMTSELLDWYEEGTWTGTLTAATPPTTPITKTGRYTRIGNQITIAIEFDNVDTSGAAGAMEVTGLPFAATAAGYGPVMKSGIGTDVIMAGVYGGLSKVIFSDAATMSTTNIVAAAGVYLRFSATYFV